MMVTIIASTTKGDIKAIIILHCFGNTCSLKIPDTSKEKSKLILYYKEQN